VNATLLAFAADRLAAVGMDRNAATPGRAISRHSYAAANQVVHHAKARDQCLNALCNWVYLL